MHLSKSVTLFDVIIILDFNVNLLSVNAKLFFDETTCIVQDSQSKVTVGAGNEFGELYYLDGSISSSNNLQSFKNSQCCVSKVTWHNRLSHLDDRSLNVLEGLLVQDMRVFLLVMCVIKLNNLVIHFRIVNINQLRQEN